MYQVKYRRWLVTRTIPTVLAHTYNKDQDKMGFFTPQGYFEVCKWSKHAIILGPDWKAQLDLLEKERTEKQLQG